MGKTIGLFIIGVIFTGCASGLKKDSFFYSDVSQYDAICEDLKSEKTFSYHLDVSIESRSRSLIEVKNHLGTKTKLKAADCILERGARLKERPDGLGSQPFLDAQCKIGALNFTDTNLQLMDQDNAFNYLRKADGKVWVLPKGRCELSEQTPSLGDE